MAFNPQNPNGQATSANSAPVVIASDQGAILISAASLPLPTGASTETTLALIKAKTDNIDVLLSTRTKPADTQPVSLATNTPTIAAGTNAIGSVSSVDTTSTGSIAAAAASVVIALNGKSGVAIQITGTWVGTLQFEGTVDGTNWVTVNGVVAGTSTPGSTTTTNGIVRVTPSGLAQVRITSTAWTSGTATISMRASDATGGTFLNQSLTAGTNSIGKVVIDQTTNIIAATTMQNAAVAVGNGTNLNVQGYVSAIISLTGTMGASTAVAFEVSTDDTTFVPITGHQMGLAGNLAVSTTNTGDFRFNVAGYKSIRARVSVFGTGSITAKGYVSALPGHSTTVNANIIASLPTGANTIGAVTGTFFQATQPVSLATNTPVIAAGTNVIGALTANQSVNLAQVNGAAVSATNPLPSTNSDGTNTANVLKGDSTAAGQNSLLTAGGYLSVPFTTTTVAAVGTTDAANYSSVSVQINSQGTSSSIAFQTSNDNVNWVSNALESASSTGSVNQTSSVSGLTYYGTVKGRYFRLNVTGISAGTTAGTIVFSTLTKGVDAVNANQAGTWTTTSTPVTPTAFLLKSAATTNATSIKASAGTVYSVTVSNTGAAAAFVKLFNTAAAPTVGTTIPDLTIPVAANGLVSFEYGATGMRLGTGIALSITNLVADADATVIAANQVKVMIAYT